mmetsp:Transcript_19487/g.22418  ORF Transcript_19487/g.22418 Transcript_19487/m.22418 type:complete len:203 (+) Transcript_19487:798-1406(+)
MTFPKVASDLLFAIACKAATPSTPDFNILSDPAKSAKSSCFLSTLSPIRSTEYKCTRQCDREDRAFRLWPTVVRVSSIVRANLIMSCGVVSTTNSSPTVTNDFSTFSVGGCDDAGCCFFDAWLTGSNRAFFLASRSSRSFSWRLKHFIHWQCGGCTPKCCEPAETSLLAFAMMAPRPPTCRPTDFVPTCNGALSASKSYALS